MRTQTKIEPSFPERPRPAGAPNVVVVLLDDVGFARFGCLGSTTRTPNMDRLVGQGLRYNRFQVGLRDGAGDLPLSRRRDRGASLVRQGPRERVVKAPAWCVGRA